VHSSDKTCRNPHGIRLSGVFNEWVLKGKNDDKNSVIFKMIGFLLYKINDQKSINCLTGFSLINMGA